MVPITSLVNTSKSYPLSSPLFEGAVVAHIKGLTDEQGRVRSSEYFEREDRKGVTWSIQVQGLYYSFRGETEGSMLTDFNFFDL